MTTNVNHNLSPMQAIRLNNKAKNGEISSNGIGPYNAVI
jgi:hypothetical protein